MSGTTSPQVDTPADDAEPAEPAERSAERADGSADRTARLRHAVTARPLVSAVVVLVVIAAVVSAFVFTGGSSSSAAGATTGLRTTTTLTAAATGTVKASVSTSGTFAAADTEDVSFGSSAEITSVKVAEGEKVAKGQVLGTIATVGLEQTLAQARATLADARSTLAAAENASDSTDTQLAADKASVASAKSAVSDATTALAGATLTSPIAGTVATVNVATGDQASGSGAVASSSSGSASTGSGGTGGGSTGGTGTAGSASGSSGSGASSSSSTSGDFVIVGGKSWTVSATVDDTEVGLLAKGDQAQITTDNVTGTVFGTVASVAVLSSGSSTSASYPVTVAVTGSPAGLHDGASATVSIIYKQVTNVLTVPTTAVHTDATGSYVYLDRSGAETKQVVRIGLSSGGTTQITSGLTAGQQVYVTTVRRTAGTGTQNGRAGTGTGGYPGGGTGGFPGGGTGGFPGGGTGGFGGGR